MDSDYDFVFEISELFKDIFVPAIDVIYLLSEADKYHLTWLYYGHRVSLRKSLCEELGNVLECLLLMRHGKPVRNPIRGHRCIQTYDAVQRRNHVHPQVLFIAFQPSSLTF